MNLKKFYLSIFFFCLLSIIFIPFLANAAGLVPCGNKIDPDFMGPSQDTQPCTINDFFIMLANIYNFIVTMIAAPLAVIAIIVGAIMMLISAGNPNLFGMGKKILYAAIIGLVLVLCSWLIIDFIVTMLGGASGSWANPPT